MNNSTEPIATLCAFADKHHLGKFKDALLQHVSQAVALDAQRSADQDIPVSSSKLGGEPDVAPDFIWPVRNGQPLSFVAQVNLSNVPEFSGGKLPGKGLLSFFYDDTVWGFDPKDKDGFKVFLFEDEPSRLMRFKTPVIEIKKNSSEFFRNDRKSQISMNLAS